MEKFSLDIPRMGYFILYRNKGNFIGNQIEKQQAKKGFSKEDSRYTHIEVSGGGQYSVCVEPPKAFICNDIRKKYPGVHIKVMKYSSDTFNTKRYKVAFWASSLCNLKYDFFGVGSFVLKIFRHSKKKYFCSENALYALRKVCPEALLLLAKPSDAMPAHFLSDKFECVWEGNLPDKV